MLVARGAVARGADDRDGVALGVCTRVGVEAGRTVVLDRLACVGTAVVPRDAGAVPRAPALEPGVRST